MAEQRVHRDPQLSPEERARQKAVREWFQRERPTLQQLVESGDADPPISMALYIQLRAAIGTLKKAREAAGLTLADVARRSGVEEAELARMETGPRVNPPLDLVTRYADALGKRLSITVEDAVAAS